MGIPSKYDDYKCGRCGTTIKKGAMINQIDGKWCSNPECGKSEQSPPPPKPQKTGTVEKPDLDPTEVTPVPPPDPMVACGAFIDLMHSKKVPGEQWEACAKVWNTERMQS